MKNEKWPTAKFWRVCEILLKYLFAALLIFVPLYPKFPVFFIGSSSVAVRAEDFLIALLGIVTLPFVWKFKKDLAKNLIIKAFLVYWLVGFVSVLSAVLVTHTAPVSLALLHWLRRIEYMLPFVSGLILVQQRSNFRLYTELILPVAVGVFLYGIGQLYFGIPVISTQNSEFSKGLALTLQPGVNISSTFAGHYDLATYLVMTLALGAALVWVYKTRSRILYLLASICCYWLLLQTGSRIAFLAFLVAIPITLLISKRKWIIVPVLIIGLIGGLSTPALSGRLGTLLKTLPLNKIIKLSTVSPVWAAADAATPQPTPTLRPIQQDRSTSIRLDVEWPRALRALIKNPFVGTGFDSITLATDNDYLRTLGETGILGFLSFLSVILLLIADIVRGLKLKLPSLEHQYLIGLLSAVLGFLLIATFIDVFESSKVATLFWMYTGLASGIVTRLPSKNEK